MFDEIDLRNKKVYFAVPKHSFNDPLVERGYQLIKSQKPLEILDARNLFKSNEEWAKTGLAYLDDCDVMIISSFNHSVGKGVFLEYIYFKENVSNNIFFYLESYHGRRDIKENFFQKFIQVTKLKIVDQDNWSYYAKVEY